MSDTLRSIFCFQLFSSSDTFSTLFVQLRTAFNAFLVSDKAFFFFGFLTGTCCFAILCTVFLVRFHASSGSQSCSFVFQSCLSGFVSFFFFIIGFVEVFLYTLFSSFNQTIEVPSQHVVFTGPQISLHFNLVYHLWSRCDDQV